MRRKKQTQLQSYAAVVTQKPFNTVWFPLFKGVLWTGCAGFKCCLKVALRRILFVPWGKKYSSLKSLSVMFHVHIGELTEGRWVGKADLNFIDWTEQKYQAVNHRWGVLDRYECVFLCFPWFSLLFTVCKYLLISEWKRLEFLNISQGASFNEEIGISCLWIRGRWWVCEMILYNSTIYFVSDIWKCLCHWCCACAFFWYTFPGC